VAYYPVTQAELWQEGQDETSNYIGSNGASTCVRRTYFFGLCEKGKIDLGKLSDIADVKRAFTSGSNDFFYVKRHNR